MDVCIHIIWQTSWVGLTIPVPFILRLKDADDLLQTTEEEEDATTANDQTLDLLERRLNDSIAKATDELQHNSGGGLFYVTPDVDADAAAIEAEEQKVEVEWTSQHGIIDTDGRARCSFSFCRKLFKDEVFLEKHLKKKHFEFLKAEWAKCHDGYMMKAWDAEIHRPVPHILVDCGSNFGLVPSPVVGATPLAVDPEPALWQQEEARRAARQQEQEQQQQHHHAPLPPPPPSRRGNFVDVDDMKEEKVELSFDAAAVIPPPKKKKKKKKLL